MTFLGHLRLKKTKLRSKYFCCGYQFKFKGRWFFQSHFSEGSWFYLHWVEIWRWCWFFILYRWGDTFFIEEDNWGVRNILFFFLSQVFFVIDASVLMETGVLVEEDFHGDTFLGLFESGAVKGGLTAKFLNCCGDRWFWDLH